MDYTDYINSELLILVPVLYLIGLALKKSCISDKWIPMILGIVSVLLSFAWVFSSYNLLGFKQILGGIFTSITQGILAAGTSVYVNQLYIQFKKEK